MPAGVIKTDLPPLDLPPGFWAQQFSRMPLPTMASGAKFVVESKFAASWSAKTAIKAGRVLRIPLAGGLAAVGLFGLYAATAVQQGSPAFVRLADVVDDILGGLVEKLADALESAAKRAGVLEQQVRAAAVAPPPTAAVAASSRPSLADRFSWGEPEAHAPRAGLADRFGWGDPEPAPSFWRAAAGSTLSVAMDDPRDPPPAFLERYGKMLTGFGAEIAAMPEIAQAPARAAKEAERAMAATTREAAASLGNLHALGERAIPKEIKGAMATTEALKGALSMHAEMMGQMIAGAVKGARAQAQAQMLMLSIECAILGAMEVTAGVAALLTYDYTDATIHFIAAGLFGAAATLAGLGASGAISIPGEDEILREGEKKRKRRDNADLIVDLRGYAGPVDIRTAVERGLNAVNAGAAA